MSIKHRCIHHKNGYEQETDNKDSQTNHNAKAQPGASWSVLLNGSYHKEYHYGLGVGTFLDIKHFMKELDLACSGTPVFLYACYYEEFHCGLGVGI